MRKQYEATKVKMQAGIEGASNSEYWSMKPKKMAKKAGKSTSNLKLNKTKANPRKRPSICGSTKCKWIWRMAVIDFIDASNTSQTNNITRHNTNLGSGFKPTKKIQPIACKNTSKVITQPLTSNMVDFYKKYLTSIRDNRDSYPLPVPINELSKTLSIETYSLTNSIQAKDIINKITLNKVRHSYKDRSASTEEQSSLSSTRMDVDENVDTKINKVNICKFQQFYIILDDFVTRSIPIKTKQTLNSNSKVTVVPKGILADMHIDHSSTNQTRPRRGDVTKFSSCRTSISVVEANTSFCP
jgi:hypothetical protein